MSGSGQKSVKRSMTDFQNILMQHTIPMIETLSPILNRKTIKGRKISALDPMGKDRMLLTAMADQRFVVNGFSNKNLREVLVNHHQFDGKSKK